MRIQTGELAAVYEVVAGDVGVSVEQILYRVRARKPITEARVRLALKHLVAKGHLSVSKRDGIKHLPWQKSVPVRRNVYTAIA